MSKLPNQAALDRLKKRFTASMDELQRTHRTIMTRFQNKKEASNNEEA